MTSEITQASTELHCSSVTTSIVTDVTTNETIVVTSTAEGSQDNDGSTDLESLEQADPVALQIYQPEETSAEAPLTLAIAQEGQPSSLTVETLLWERDETGSAVASKIALKEKVVSALESEAQITALLADYGLTAAGDNALSNLALSLGQGETGQWDGEIYTPDWTVAFSDNGVIFQLTFDAVDPLDSSYALTGLTAEVFLNFDRSGIDLSTIQRNPGTTQPIAVSSENGVGILLAFGGERQAALGLNGDPVEIELPAEFFGHDVNWQSATEHASAVCRGSTFPAA